MNIIPEVHTFPELTTTPYRIDPMSPFGQYYTGLWQDNHVQMPDGSSRFYRVYVPENSRKDDEPLLICVPNRTDSAEFLVETGWKELADKAENGQIIYLLEPEAGTWKSPEAEETYFEKAIFEIMSRKYVYNANNQWRWALYGEGAYAAQRYIINHPLMAAAVVVTNAEACLPEEFLKEKEKEPFVFRQSASLMSTKFDVKTEDVVFPETYGEYPIPLWYIGNENSPKAFLSYFRTNNHCLDEAETLQDGTLVYREDPFSSCPQTYLQKMGEVRITEKADASHYENTAEGYFKCLRKFNKAGSVSPFSTFLRASVDESRFLREEEVIDGILREWFIYLPSGYKKDGSPMPTVFFNHGDGQTGKVIMRQTDWFHLGEKKGFIVVCPSAPLTQNALPKGMKRPYAVVPHPNWCASREWPNEVDDVHFYKVMMDSLFARYNIDRSRVYITGQSNGNYMTTRIAWELPKYFAAMATTGGGMGFDSQGNPDYNLADADEYDVPSFYNMGMCEFRGCVRQTLDYHMKQYGLKEEDALYYKDGQHESYIWLKDGQPVVRMTNAAYRAHSFLPEENRLAWEDWLCRFRREPDGKISFMKK